MTCFPAEYSFVLFEEIDRISQQSFFCLQVLEDIEKKKEKRAEEIKNELKERLREASEEERDAIVLEYAKKMQDANDELDDEKKRRLKDKRAKLKEERMKKRRAMMK